MQHFFLCGHYLLHNAQDVFVSLVDDQGGFLLQDRVLHLARDDFRLFLSRKFQQSHILDPVLQHRKVQLVIGEILAPLLLLVLQQVQLLPLAEGLLSYPVQRVLRVQVLVLQLHRLVLLQLVPEQLTVAPDQVAELVPPQRDLLLDVGQFLARLLLLHGIVEFDDLPVAVWKTLAVGKRSFGGG